MYVDLSEGEADAPKIWSAHEATKKLKGSQN